MDNSVWSDKAAALAAKVDLITEAKFGKVKKIAVSSDGVVTEAAVKWVTTPAAAGGTDTRSNMVTVAGSMDAIGYVYCAV